MPVEAIQSSTLWPTVALVVLATVTDVRSRRIPNALVLPFLASGVAWAAISHGWAGVSQSLLGVLVAVAALGVFCFLGGMGLGDLKLCAAVGTWVGPSQLLIALVMTGLIGALMAVGWAITGGFLGQALGDTASLFSRHGKRRTLADPSVRSMPYAPAIALGTILSFLGRHI